MLPNGVVHYTQIALNGSIIFVNISHASVSVNTLTGIKKIISPRHPSRPACASKTDGQTSSSQPHDFESRCVPNNIEVHVTVTCCYLSFFDPSLNEQCKKSSGSSSSSNNSTEMATNSTPCALGQMFANDKW